MSTTGHLFKIENLRWMLYGALFFWMPDILIHAIERYEFDNVVLVSVACTLALIAGYFVTAFFSAHTISARHPGFLILGVWCAGGLGTMVASSFASGGFAGGGLYAIGLSLLVIIVPPLSFILATYDGTLFALLGVTVLMIVEMTALSARRVQLRFRRVAA